MKTLGLPVPLRYREVQTQLTVEGRTLTHMHRQIHTCSPRATMTQQPSNQPQRHTLCRSFTPAASKQNELSLEAGRQKASCIAVAELLLTNHGQICPYTIVRCLPYTLKSH